jgi:hypothetical protein
MRIHLFCFSIFLLFLFFLFLFSLSFFLSLFFEDPSFARERFHSLEFSRRITW